MRVPNQGPLHVRNWENLIRSQQQSVKQWSRRMHAHFLNPAARSISQKRSALDSFYGECCIPTPACTDVHMCAIDGSCDGGMTLVSSRFLPEMPRGASGIFHRVVRHAKSVYWTSWLRDLQSVCPRMAARMVRRRFRSCWVALRLSPAHVTNPSGQRE